MTYRVEVSRQAQRSIRKMHPMARAKVEQAILALEADPRPAGCLKLTDAPHGWRLHLGDYRLVYEIYDDTLLVWVEEAGPRGGMYKHR